MPASPACRAWLEVALVVIYVIAVVVMKWTESAHSRRVRAAKHICNRLQRRLGKNQGLASFDYIRSHVNASYTNEFLFKLVEDCPDEFMRIKCTQDRPGLKLIDDAAD